MRRGLDWYKRDPIAFIDAVQGMGPELIGAYAVLIDLLYARAGETPRDDRHLSGVLGCSTRKAKALTDALIESGKIELHDGFIVNSRAKSEAKPRRELSEMRANAGRIGGINSGKARKNNSLDKANASSKHEAEKRREDKSKNTPLTPLGGDGVENEFDDWWSHYPRKVAVGGARKAFVAARKKVSFEDLLDAVKRYAILCQGKEARHIAHGATWLNQERWSDQEGVSAPTINVSDEELQKTRVEHAEGWLARHDTIPAWMDIPETANALVEKGHDYEKLRLAGFSLPTIRRCASGGSEHAISEPVVPIKARSQMGGVF